MPISEALARLNPLAMLRGEKKPAPAPTRSRTQVALYQKSEPSTRDQAAFIKAWDKLPWMRAVVEKIAYAKASVRWTVAGVKDEKTKLYKKTGIGSIRDPKVRRKAMQDEGAESEGLEDHPIINLFADPNPVLTALEVSMLKTAFEYVGGESFMIMEASPPGKVPNILWPFPPHWCIATPTKDRPEFHFNNSLGFDEWIPMERVLWQHGLNLTNPYGRAKGIYQTMEDELSSYENASALVNYQFYNRNRPDFIMSLEGASDDQVVAMEDRVTGKFQGIAQMFRSLITNAKLKVEKIPSDFVHSQLIELLAFMRDVQLQVPGVPPEAMGIVENSNRATITAAMSIFMEGVVVPILEKEREFYQKHLVPIFDDRIILDYDNPVPEDKDFALAAMNGGKVIVQVNEPRALVGLRPLEKEEGGELWMVPAGISLKEKLEEAEPPPAFGGPPGAPPFGRKPGEKPGEDDESKPVADTGSVSGGESIEPGAEEGEKGIRPTRAGESPARKKTEVMKALGLV